MTPRTVLSGVKVGRLLWQWWRDRRVIYRSTWAPETGRVVLKDKR